MENIRRKPMLILSSSIFILTMSGCTATDKNKLQSNLKSSQQNNAFISGVVDGEKYIAMDKSFTINLPYKKGSREYELMEIDEFYNEKGVSVSFGAVGKQNNIFNIEIIKFKNENSFEDESIKLLSQYRKDLLLNYRSKPKLLKKHNFRIHGYNTIHWNLLQKVKPGKVPGLNYGLLDHQVFSINLDKKIAFIWVQKTANKANKHNKIITAYDFATSLIVPKNDFDLNMLSSIH